jgi:putative heme-binding domain-containing protein
MVYLDELLFGAESRSCLPGRTSAEGGPLPEKADEQGTDQPQAKKGRDDVAQSFPPERTYQTQSFPPERIYQTQSFPAERTYQTQSFPAEKTYLSGLGSQHAFTCEPFSNLVQHNLLIDDGVSFRLERDPAEAEAKTDFFASEDRWCRPVMVRTGPDGALWIVDMYRYMIEHPHWLPKEGQDELRPFFRSGDDRGRIYRIVPVSGTALAAGADAQLPRTPRASALSLTEHRMDQLSTAELVKSLESPNGWRRDTAQQLLISAPDESAFELLSTMVAGGDRPTARLHALCTLDGLGKLSADVVEIALKDSHPGVRRQAVRLAPSAKVPLTSLLSLTKDPDAKVRLELACVAGQVQDAGSANILGDLLLCDTDPYLRAAVISSLNAGNINNTVDRFGTVVQVDARANRPGESRMPGFTAAERDELTGILFEQAASIANAEDLERLLLLTVDDADDSLQAWQMKSFARMLDRLHARGWSVSDHFADKDHQARIANAFQIARQISADPAEDEILRVAAIPLLLRNGDQPHDVATLQEMLMPQTPVSVQEAAIRHLGRQSTESSADALLAGWSSHSPLIRSQILTEFSSRPEWITQLLTQLESGSVAAGEIDAAMRQRLLTTRDAVIRARLENVFTSGSSVDRKAVMEAFQPALKLTGDAARGALAFGKKCATCHKQGGVGHEVGPNLASLTTRTPDSLFTAILDPSAAVEAKYLNFVVATTSGRSVIGMLSTETGSSITLLAAEGKFESVLRTDIEELRSTGKSLMPDGVEKDLTHQDLADVIEYVKTLQK